MDVTLIAILCAAILSGYFAALALPRILLISLRKKLIDPIDQRKVHKTTASRLGGVSFFPALFMSTTIVLVLVNIFKDGTFVYSNDVLMSYATMFMLFMIGIYDDVVGVKYRSKFVVQIITALLMTASGVYLQSFYSVDSSYELPLWFAIPLTVLLITFITNSINLIDGINGLASMLSIIAFAAYGVILMIAGDYIYAMICFATMGAIIPFWRNNVFGVRKRIDSRIFMGDCGALVIGFSLSIMAIRIWNLDNTSSNVITSNLCHVLAYTMLLTPCFDVISVMAHRFANKQSIFLPDKNHIHHRLMAWDYA